MPKKTGIIFLITGAVLILSALLLLLSNRQEDRRAGQEAQLLLAGIQSVLPPETEPTTALTETPPDSTVSTGPTAPPEILPAEMPVVVIDGYGCIGYLSIPDLGLELPVISEWSYSSLEVAPCRHFGSSRTDDLVIAGHNYKTHFRSLSSLEEGAEILFTDMDGIENRYTVRRMDKLDPESVDAVQNSGYDLVLYTCTPGGATRLAVFCDRVQENTPKSL